MPSEYIWWPVNAAGGEQPDARRLAGRGTDDESNATPDGNAARPAQVSAGGLSTCAIATDHTLWCWGGNNNGQLGAGSTTGSDSPARVEMSHWRQVAAGASDSCGIDADSILWCWGGNGFGELGEGPVGHVLVPEPVRPPRFLAERVSPPHSAR